MYITIDQWWGVALILTGLVLFVETNPGRTPGFWPGVWTYACVIGYLVGGALILQVLGLY
jgi:hypothetical protein